MKIETVDNIHSIFEGAEIHMNKKGIFTLKLINPLPDEYRYDELPTHNTLDGIRTLIKEFVDDCIRQKFHGKKIYLSLSSSSKSELYNKSEKGKFERNELGHIKGVGLGINYAIVNVYTFKVRKTYQTGVNQEKPWKINVRYEWVEQTLYEVVGGTFKGYSKKGGVGQKNDTLFSLDETHIMDYSEEVENYLISITTALGDMVERVTNFFNVKPEALVEKIKTNDGNLLLN